MSQIGMTQADQMHLRELLAEDVRKSLQRFKEPNLGRFSFPPSRKALEEAAIRSADLKVEARDLRKALKAKGIDRLAQTGKLEEYLPDVTPLGRAVRGEVPPLRKSRWPLAMRHYLADNPEFVGRGSFSSGITMEDAVVNFAPADMGAQTRAMLRRAGTTEGVSVGRGIENDPYVPPVRTNPDGTLRRVVDPSERASKVFGPKPKIPEFLPGLDPSGYGRKMVDYGNKHSVRDSSTKDVEGDIVFENDSDTASGQEKDLRKNKVKSVQRGKTREEVFQEMVDRQNNAAFEGIDEFEEANKRFDIEDSRFSDMYGDEEFFDQAGGPLTDQKSFSWDDWDDPRAGSPVSPLSNDMNLGGMSPEDRTFGSSPTKRDQELIREGTKFKNLKDRNAAKRAERERFKNLYKQENEMLAIVREESKGRKLVQDVDKYTDARSKMTPAQLRNTLLLSSESALEKEAYYHRLKDPRPEFLEPIVTGTMEGRNVVSGGVLADKHRMIPNEPGVGLVGLGNRAEDDLRYMVMQGDINKMTYDDLPIRKKMIYKRFKNRAGLQRDFLAWRSYAEDLRAKGNTAAAAGIDKAMDLVYDQWDHSRKYTTKRLGKGGKVLSPALSWTGSRLDPVNRASFWKGIDWQATATMLTQEPGLLHPVVRDRMQELLPHIEEGVARQIKNPKLAGKVLGAIKTAIKVAI